jgi:hypothetical protein
MGLLTYHTKTNQIKATPTSFYLSFLFLSSNTFKPSDISRTHILKIALLSRCVGVMLVLTMVCAALRVPEGQRSSARIILPEGPSFLQRFS